jgi:hypothetical protein
MAVSVKLYKTANASPKRAEITSCTEEAIYGKA